MLKAFKFRGCKACPEDPSSGLWGATEAISGFLLLERTRPLYASVAKHNAASIRVLQKCGLVSDNASSEDDGATHILLKLGAKP